MRSTAVPGYSGSIIGAEGDCCVPEDALREVVLGLLVPPVVETNADALLVLLETAAAAKLENRMLADVVANEKTIGDKNRIWRDQWKVCKDPVSCLGLEDCVSGVNLSTTELFTDLNDDGSMSCQMID